MDNKHETPEERKAREEREHQERLESIKRAKPQDTLWYDRPTKGYRYKGRQEIAPEDVFKEREI